MLGRGAKNEFGLQWTRVEEHGGVKTEVDMGSGWMQTRTLHRAPMANGAGGRSTPSERWCRKCEWTKGDSDGTFVVHHADDGRAVCASLECAYNEAG